MPERLRTPDLKLLQDLLSKEIQTAKANYDRLFYANVDGMDLLEEVEKTKDQISDLQATLQRGLFDVQSHLFASEFYIRSCILDNAAHVVPTHRERFLRNTSAHGGNIEAGIITIKSPTITSHTRSKWRDAFKKLYGLEFDLVQIGNEGKRRNAVFIRHTAWKNT